MKSATDAALPRLAVVAYHTGRVGSSAVMGLLRAAGLNVGDDARLNKPAAMNPKGFFELKSQQRFLCEVFADCYPAVTPAPALLQVEAVARDQAQAYHRLLQEEFAGAFPAAIKAPRGLSLTLLSFLREYYDIRIIRLVRNEDDQVRSTLRVWRTVDDPLRRNADEILVRGWISQWRKFLDDCLYRYDFPRLEFSFDRLIADPMPQVRILADFLGIMTPPAELVTAWLDPTLVNREKL